METIRICIGTEPKLRIPQKVLEYTIRKYTTGPVEIHLMIDGKWEESHSGSTGFSFRRWMIPEYFDHKGFAIYMDADQIVFEDVRKLWDSRHHVLAPVTNCVWAACKGRRALVSVMLINCANAEYWQHIPSRLQSGELNRAQVMHGKWIRPRPVDIGYEWNHIDFFVPYETKLLHYSDLKRQPWFQPQHPFAHVWRYVLIDAMAAGAVTREDFDWARSIYRKKEGLHPDYDRILEDPRLK